MVEETWSGCGRLGDSSGVTALAPTVLPSMYVKYGLCNTVVRDTSLQDNSLMYCQSVYQMFS